MRKNHVPEKKLRQSGRGFAGSESDYYSFQKREDLLVAGVRFVKEILNFSKICFAYLLSPQHEYTAIACSSIQSHTAGSVQGTRKRCQQRVGCR